MTDDQSDPSTDRQYSGMAFSIASGGQLLDSWNWGDETQSFDAFQTKQTYHDYHEWEFYDYRLAEYNENEWYSWLVDYLVGELFCDYEFVGDGAPEVYKFFEETCPNANQEIEKMGLNVVREGTGGMKKYSDNGDLKQIRAINGRLIRLAWTDKRTGETTSSQYATSKDEHDKKWLQVTINHDKEFREYIQIWKNKTPTSYYHPTIAICRLKLDPRSPYGIGFGRSCFHVIAGLKDMDRDILAAIKQLAANLKIAALDLSGYDTNAEKDAALKTFVTDNKKLETATTGFVAIDKNHAMFFMGAGPDGQGGRSGDRLLKTMDFIEPVLSALLMNFLMAIGIVEQTGANKSLIARQEQRAERQIQRYQRTVSRFIETQIIPHITDKPCKVVFNRYYEPELWFHLFEIGAVSREWVQKRFAIVDDGKTFVYDLQRKAADVAWGDKDAQNQGDGEEKGRKEPKSKPAQEATM